MTLTPLTFIIICPLLFLAGFIDAIGGGGGLVSLPAYLLAGVPVHNAVATNKLSSACGTTLATIRFIRHKMVIFKLAVPAVVAAFIGSSIGAKLSLMMPEKLMQQLLIIVLPIAAIIVFNKNSLKDSDNNLIICPRLYITVTISSLIIGAYDGFYGPGTGTFLIICFTLFGKMKTSQANGLAKVINLTTNITSLAVFLLDGQVIFIIGIVAAACNMAGSYLGSGLVLKKGSKIIKPCIILVLLLLLIKIITEL